MFKRSDDTTASPDPNSLRQTHEFSPEQRRILLTIAHHAIASKAAGMPLPVLSSIAQESPGVWAALDEPRGVFTTLYLDGELRGCVGYATPVHALAHAVAETACAAAFEDSRFPPVTAGEVPDLKVSLSVLSPLYPIDPARVEVGRHGLVVSHGFRRGLLLPQVPVEHGWDRVTFLEQTCRKAGLPKDTWRKSATIEAFEAEVFGDDELGLIHS